MPIGPTEQSPGPIFAKHAAAELADVTASDPHAASVVVPTIKRKIYKIIKEITEILVC